MRAAFRYVKLPVVLSRQLGRGPAMEAWRFGTQVDRDVVDGATRAADKLRFGVLATLEVHTTQCALRRVVRDAALGKRSGEAQLAKRLFVEDTRKHAALVY